MIRIAAVGDVHFDRQSRGRIRDHLEQISQEADIFLLAGDLTQTGHLEEMNVLAEDLAHAKLPVIAVLGNHDYHLDQEDRLTTLLESKGVTVLEGTTATVQVRDTLVGIAGIKGFGGGFPGACASEFGEIEMKSFVRHSRIQAQRLREALLSLDTTYKVALMHYSPVPDTLLGEKLEIYPFLGSYLLGEVVDEAKVDLVFHGHAHKGVEKGTTYGGVPVRNVAQPVIRHVCNIYVLDKQNGLSQSPGPVFSSAAIH